MGGEVRYARTDDGVDIAFAITGQGPPLLALRQFMAADVHSELSEGSRGMVPWPELAKSHTVVLFDWRGTGLSAPAPAQSLESGLSDMSAVVGAAAVTSFDIFAALTPAHFAIAYAAVHPQQVRRMVLWNPGQGSMRSVWADLDLPPIEMTHFRDYAQLAALRLFGWEGTAARRFSEMMTERFTGESWTRLNESIEAIDGTSYVPDVRCPCLIVMDHNAVNQQLVNPERQQFTRGLAASIPSAQLSIAKRGEARAALDRIQSFLCPEDGEPTPARHETAGTAVILFADIVDSTALTERMGDAAFRERARSLDEALRGAVRERGGSVIDAKTLGDGILATFPTASQGIAAALACVGAAQAVQLQLHVGLHAGDVIREAGNVFGGAVNIAARISALSAPGEVLVSRTVADLARTSAGVTFDDRGEHALKGVGDPVRVYAVRRSEAG